MKQNVLSPKKRIVVISYAAWPRTAPRSMRTTELVKGFANAGHDVVLYILTGNYDYQQFEKETKVKIRSLGKTIFIRFDPSKGTHYGIITKALHRIVGRILEFPAIELVRNVYNALKKESKFDLLISIAVPYPIHWGVALSKKRCPQKFENSLWVADCGDPYMGNPFRKRPFYFKYLEKWFCRNADYLSVPIEDAKDAYYPEFRDKIKVIPQGFDFEGIHLEENYIGNSIPTFIYAGVFYEDLRDPRPFLDYLLTLKRDFKFIIYTKTKRLIEPYVEPLRGKLEVYDYIPRKELLIKMSKADFLVNFENISSVQSPSKLIDYALTHRPILSFKTNVKLPTEDFESFLSADYKNKFEVQGLNRYNIVNIVNEFLKLS